MWIYRIVPLSAELVRVAVLRARGTRAAMLSALLGVGIVAAIVCPVAVHAQSNLPTRQLIEELRITASDTSVGTSLTDVSAGLILPDGRIVTAHAREGVLRVFSGDGRFLRMVGRKGDGPNEFRGPNGLGMIGDTLWVRDLLAARYLLFDLSFNPVGMLRTPVMNGYVYGVVSRNESIARATRDSRLIADLGAGYRGFRVISGV